MFDDDIYLLPLSPQCSSSSRAQSLALSGVLWALSYPACNSLMMVFIALRRCSRWQIVLRIPSHVSS